MKNTTTFLAAFLLLGFFSCQKEKDQSPEVSTNLRYFDAYCYGDRERSLYQSNSDWESFWTSFLESEGIGVLATSTDFDKALVMPIEGCPCGARTGYIFSVLVSPADSIKLVDCYLFVGE